MKKELEEWRKEYKELDIADRELHLAIEKGIQKAKRKDRYKRWGIFPGLAAAVLLITAVLTINTVPAFAAQLSKVPGLERFVELVQFDKGQQAAIENDYFQVIDKTKTKGDLSLTVDGVIRDQNGLVLFYTISSDKDLDRVRLEETSITGADGEELSYYNQTEFKAIKDESSGTYSQRIEIFTDEEIPYEAFTFSAEVVGVETLENGTGNQLRENIVIDFEADATTESIHYQVDQTVRVDDQLIHIDAVTIQPLRTTVKLQADPQNSMRIFSIDDIALADETGEEWTSISNGMVASGQIEEEGYELYLQSNYFEQPEELTLTFSKVQAVERDKAYMRFDLKNQEILHDPHDMFTEVVYENGWLSVEMAARDDFYMYPFGEIYDKDGNKVDQEFSSGSNSSDGKTDTYSQAIYTDEPIIDVTLQAYPHWIEEKIEIPLK